MADNGRLTVDQKVKVVLFYAETKSVVATQRSFRAHFGTRWAPCKQTIYSSLGTIFQPMRINSVPDVKCFCNIKNVFCVQSMVWHFVRNSVYVHRCRYLIEHIFSFVLHFRCFLQCFHTWKTLSWNMLQLLMLQWKKWFKLRKFDKQPASAREPFFQFAHNYSAYLQVSISRRHRMSMPADCRATVPAKR